MSVPHSLFQQSRSLTKAAAQSSRVFVKDVGHGLLEISHNGFALLGVAVVALALFFFSREDIQHRAEQTLFGWLQARQEARLDPLEQLSAELREPQAILRATATDPKALDRQQAAVAHWLSKRYKVAPEPISRLVQEAWLLGNKVRLEPTLLLAIMAVESGFNPFAQSSVGAQGLMQVMTRIHDDKYEAFGGNHAAFDPVTNMRVGVLVLKECIARAGGVEAGLRYYVGAANLPDDGGYAGKVMAEQSRLREVMAGRAVSVNAPLVASSPSAAQPAPALAPAPSLDRVKEVQPVQPPLTAAPEKVALLMTSTR